jgi:hypothetical protein
MKLLVLIILGIVALGLRKDDGKAELAAALGVKFLDNTAKLAEEEKPSESS